MSISINYKKNLSKRNVPSQILFVDEKFNISGLKKHISKAEFLFVSDLKKTKNLKKEIVTFDISSKRKIILVSLKNNITSINLEKLGAKFYDFLKDQKDSEFELISDSISIKIKNFVGFFLHGLKLKSYFFVKYKSKKNQKNISIYVTGKNVPSLKDQNKFKALEEGSFYTRDLVSEPGNILHPDEYARRLNLLKKDGLKINVYDDKKLKKLGMNTLLGVGQGSIRGSYLVTIEWNGLNNNSKPLAFVGK